MVQNQTGNEHGSVRSWSHSPGSSSTQVQFQPFKGSNQKKSQIDSD